MTFQKYISFPKTEGVRILGIWALLKEQYYFQRQRIKFFKCHAYHFDLENPVKFSEKIIWRKIFDRNPLFPILCDKYRSREYVIERLGMEAGREILVPLIFVTEDPEEIPFDDLPEEYIVKPSHGSGWSIIVDQERRVPRRKIVSQCKKWLDRTYGGSKMEWGYSPVKPRIMIEKLLKDSEGKFVPDFKFHVFRGRVEWLFVLHDRLGTLSMARYDRMFNRFYSDTQYSDGPDIAKPENFEKMVEIAEKLAGSLDYLRVDLYNVDGKTFFGELTLYQSSGLAPFRQEGLEEQMGACWVLNRDHVRSFKPWF